MKNGSKMLKAVTKSRAHDDNGVMTYGDVFEVMRYERGLDVMPFAFGYRPKRPMLNLSGPRPNFTFLDTEEEVAAFTQALASPLVYESPGVISPEPLDRWNQEPSTLIAELMVVTFPYPEDESKDWPFLQLFAVPPKGLTSGKVKSDDLIRGRYDFLQFAAEEKHLYVQRYNEARSKAGRLDINLMGDVPFGLVDVLNPRQEGQIEH